MQNKLIVLLAAVSALVTLTEAAASTMACVPDVEKVTLVVGTTAKCTCTGSATGSATDWLFDSAKPTSGIGGTNDVEYTRTIADGDATKVVSCAVTVGGAPDTAATKTVKATEAPKKPTLKCDPAKLEKDKESVCTCTSTNAADATPTKATFSVDGGDAKDGTEGATKTGLKVKITKEAKVTCMIYFSDTVKTDASEEFKIEFSGAGGGSGSGSASLHSALSLVVMMFASIIVSIL